MKKKNNEKGVVLILLLLVVGVTSFVFFFSFANVNLTNVLGVDEQLSGFEAQERMFACVDEALINLQKNALFNTSSLSMASYNCGTNFSTVVSTTIVIVSTTYNNITRGAEIILTTDPVVIESVEETLN